MSSSKIYMLLKRMAGHDFAIRIWQQSMAQQGIYDTTRNLWYNKESMTEQGIYGTTRNQWNNEEWHDKKFMAQQEIARQGMAQQIIYDTTKNQWHNKEWHNKE